MTSRTTAIFRWIWRINGVLLFGTCLAGIVALLGLTRGLYFGVEDAPQGAITSVAGTDLSAESLTLRPFEPIKGTSLMVAPLDGRSTVAHSRPSAAVRATAMKAAAVRRATSSSSTSRHGSPTGCSRAMTTAPIARSAT